MKKIAFAVCMLMVVLSFSFVEGAWVFRQNTTIDGYVKAIDTLSISPTLRHEAPMLMIRNNSQMGYDVIMGCNTLRFAGDATIRVKFDNSPIEVFNVYYLRDFQDMMIDQSQKDDFIAKARRSNKVIVEWNLGYAGMLSFEFNLAGMGFNRLK